MERLLKLNPEFAEEARFLERIRRKIVFRDMDGLDAYLTVIRLATIKKLVSKDFYASEKLKKTYKQIAEKECGGPEKMVFKMLCGERIVFSDIRLKFLFYKEFPERSDLFANEGDHGFEIADLLFRSVYLHENISRHLQEIVTKQSLPKTILYFLCLGEILDQNYIRNMLFSIKHGSGEGSLEYWSIGLTCLPPDEFYSTLSSEMICSSFIDKVKIYRCVESLVDIEKLCVCLLEECMRNVLLVGKTYIIFLKLIEIFDLKYQFKLKLLYSWMRYFLYEKRVELFFELLENIKKAKRLDKEIAFYEAMGMLLHRKADILYVRDVAATLRDEGIVKYSFDAIISRYEKRS